MQPVDECADQIDTQGYVVCSCVFSPQGVGELAARIERDLSSHEAKASLLQREGVAVAARNVLDWCPAARDCWQVPELLALLNNILGPRCGLVRALYFDKTPEKSWALPWHRDMTIAVRSSDLPRRVFSKPTHKAGVAHVEAPEELLRQMLTLRLFLDDVTLENGPLVVLPGSHRMGKPLPDDFAQSKPVLGKAGDVLAMRPLLAHTSGHSSAETRLRRRTIHLEFAGVPDLPDGYQWHWFWPLPAVPRGAKAELS
ncbi:MAG: phytanoyl-CoA dioxygenase family protein [Pirellulales bacterium]|nr:phytanoyl-CoA dioxygenase family protein [Pirellulales bacterium]